MASVLFVIYAYKTFTTLPLPLDMLKGVDLPNSRGIYIFSRGIPPSQKNGLDKTLVHNLYYERQIYVIEVTVWGGMLLPSAEASMHAVVPMRRSSKLLQLEDYRVGYWTTSIFYNFVQS